MNLQDYTLIKDINSYLIDLRRTELKKYFISSDDINNILEIYKQYPNRQKIFVNRHIDKIMDTIIKYIETNPTLDIILINIICTNPMTSENYMNALKILIFNGLQLEHFSDIESFIEVSESNRKIYYHIENKPVIKISYDYNDKGIVYSTIFSINVKISFQHSKSARNV